MEKRSKQKRPGKTTDSPFWTPRRSPRLEFPRIRVLHTARKEQLSGPFQLPSRPIDSPPCPARRSRVLAFISYLMGIGPRPVPELGKNQGRSPHFLEIGDCP